MLKIHLKRLLVFFPLVASGLDVSSQTIDPIFEDGEGKTSIIMPKGFVGINTANSSIRFQYFYSKSAAPDVKDDTKVGRWNRLYFGVNVTGAATEGISALFSGGNFNPGGSADLFIGHRSIFFSPINRRLKTGEEIKEYTIFGRPTTASDFLTVRAGIKASKFKLYNPIQPFAQQITSQVFRGPSVQIAYTVLFNGRTSIGLTWDASKENNLDLLTLTKIKNQVTTSDPTTGTTRLVEQELSAYRGIYETSTVNTFGVDFVKSFVAENNTVFALNLYGRALRAFHNSIYKAGVGVYFFPPGKRKAAGGIYIESSDLTNKISSTPKFFKRTEIGFTVKYIMPALGGS